MKSGDFSKIFTLRQLYLKKIIFASSITGIYPCLTSITFTNQNNFKYEKLYINLADEGNTAFFSNHTGRDKYFLSPGRRFSRL